MQELPTFKEPEDSSLHTYTPQLKSILKHSNPVHNYVTNILTIIFNIIIPSKRIFWECNENQTTEDGIRTIMMRTNFRKPQENYNLKMEEETICETS